MSAPLDGLLVADFSRVLAGPLCTAWLADLGARVVKVEQPGGGDETRQWGPPWVGTDSSYFHSANRSKESIELDLNDDIDRLLAIELAGRADVVVENFRDGTMSRFGLGYDDIVERNPGVVYCSITGFGSGGGAEMPGYDFLIQAVGGLMSITGEPDGEPTKSGVALVDVLTSKDALIGILAALRSRDATSVGQRVEVNLFATLLGSLVNQASGYLASGQAPKRMGGAHPSIAPYETFDTADTQIAICCGNDRQFGRLMTVLGLAFDRSDPRLGTNAARVTNRPAMRELMHSVLRTREADVWVDRLTAARVPAGKVGSIADAFELATQLGLRPTVAMGHGIPPQVRNPITLSGTPIVSYRPPPGIGQDNARLRAWLSKEI